MTAAAGPARVTGAADLLLVNALLTTPGGDITGGWLEVRDGRISALGSGPPPAHSPGQTVELGGHRVVPGFVDPHCHGGAGHSVYTGDPGDVREAAAGHLGRGTTAMLASVATVDAPRMRAAARAIATAIEDRTAPNIVGIHFEGPFLSPARRGAQTQDALRLPDRATLEQLLEAAGGHAVSMTIAPELPGALDLIRAYAGRLTFCVGHTDADAELLRHAANQGARAVTHLFNAMRPLLHRDPGPVAAALLDSRLSCELIADGTHLADDTIRLAHRVAGAERLMLVSDAMPAAGLGDGTYRFADRVVTVERGVAFLEGTRTLAGSTLCVGDALRRVITVTGLPVGDAVRMSATTAAVLLGLDDRGALIPGHRADLVELDPEFRPVRVFLGGRAVQPA